MYASFPSIKTEGSFPHSALSQGMLHQIIGSVAAYAVAFLLMAYIVLLAGMGFGLMYHATEQIYDTVLHTISSAMINA